ncbi:hypothetical protein OSTOST_06822 [Ostertagia ostertagi]
MRRSASFIDVLSSYEVKMTSYVMPTDEYLASLNIPRCSFDFDDADQLRIHLMCAMLCCPKQIDDDGCIRAELVNKNASDITGQLMDLYAIGRKATQEDVNEFTKITKNLERLFQHPMFSKIVAMDGQANFHAVPPESIRKLYERILRGGKATRRRNVHYNFFRLLYGISHSHTLLTCNLRDGLKETLKKREANSPEAVYKSKVACNFLMELIERERLHRGLRMVEWQSVQNRYREMVTNDESEDRELMNTYIEKYGMDFSMNSLNSELIKKWTGRSQAVKGFTMPLFLPIHHEMRNNLLFVGFNDDAVLYSEEELQRDKELWQSGERAKDKKFEKERNNPVKKERGNELEGVVPLRSRQAHTERSDLLLSPDPTHSSPFATEAKPSQMYPRQQWKPEPPKEKLNSYGAAEPQYTPKFATPEDDNPDSDSGSDDPNNETGVFTDDEQPPNKEPTSKPQEKEFGATGWKSKGATSSPKPKPNASSSVQNENAAPRQSPSMMREPANISNLPKSRANPWEIENEVPELVKPTARYEPPSSTVPHAPVGSGSSANISTQPPSLCLNSASSFRFRSLKGMSSNHLMELVLLLMVGPKTVQGICMSVELTQILSRTGTIAEETMKLTRTGTIAEKVVNSNGIGLSANISTQPPPTASTPRHRSAFEACKSFGIQEERNEFKSPHGTRAPADGGTENRTRNLYERRAHTDSQQDRYDRRGDNEINQDRYDRRESGEFQRDRYDRRGDTEINQDHYDRREIGEFQRDRYDRRGNIEINQDRYGRRESGESQQDRYDRRGNVESRQDRDGYYRNDAPFRPHEEVPSGRGSRLREEQNFRSSATDRRVENDYHDARDHFRSQNSRSTLENGRSKTQPRGTDGSIFSQQIDESCIRRETSRMSSRIIPSRERSPPVTQRFVADPNNRPYPDAQRTSGGAGFSRSELRDYDQR